MDDFIPSPCIFVCKINPQTNLCSGCYRTVEEIRGWIKFTEPKKAKVLTAIDERKSKINKE